MTASGVDLFPRVFSMPRVLVPLHIDHEPPPTGSVHALAGLTMGTSWSVRLVADGEQSPDAWRDGIQEQLDKVVQEMSHWEPDSDLGRFNRAPAGTWRLIPDGFFEVLSCAIEVAQASEDAYDPAAGALVNRWGFGPDNGTSPRYDAPDFVPPTRDEVAALLGDSGWQLLEFDRTTRRIRQPGGAMLDLSAVAKGYGVDVVARWLERQGVKHYLVEVGGELRGAGMKPDGQPWWVALEEPPHAQAGSDDATLLALHGLSVATSGDYRRCFEMDGERYSHTIDPRTGWPVSNGVASVTVIHESCMWADALSTALTVMGAEEGIRFADARNFAARFLVRHGDALKERASRRFLEMLE
jgi:thiamine biosynthesis lipoprotein